MATRRTFDASDLTVATYRASTVAPLFEPRIPPVTCALPVASTATPLPVDPTTDVPAGKRAGVPGGKEASAGPVSIVEKTSAPLESNLLIPQSLGEHSVRRRKIG